jgi:hypothetical protein
MDMSLDFSRIQRDTGADKVIMTGVDGCVIQCDLFFIKNGKGATIQAEFDVADEEQFTTACEWVRYEIETRLDPDA